MVKESLKEGLQTEDHLKGALRLNPVSEIHNSRRTFYRIKKKFFKEIEHDKTKVLIHISVKQRWKMNADYRPENLKAYVDKKGWAGLTN